MRFLLRASRSRSLKVVVVLAVLVVLALETLYKNVFRASCSFQYFASCLSFKVIILYSLIGLNLAVRHEIMPYIIIL